jgi:hypothetical protein
MHARMDGSIRNVYMVSIIGICAMSTGVYIFEYMGAGGYGFGCACTYIFHTRAHFL